MTVFVFLGPTLPIAEARQELEAVYLPPVSQGDVYRATLRRPSAIGIVDGYFDRVPAVWHKEILWALSRGVRVFGAASMGALRAAELEAYGMEGVGAIFAAYRDGVFRDDDEVAVAHAGDEDAYRATSEAMVNIRSTLGRALAAGVITRPTLLALQEGAKALFYAERTYVRVLEHAATSVPEPELARLRAWLPGGRADQKREDALAMLRTMRDALRHPTKPQTAFSFAYTEYWDRLRLSVAQRDTATMGSAEADLKLVLDELRLDEQAYRATRAAALLRALGLDRARRAGLAAADDARQLEATRLFGGLAPHALDRWLDEQGLDASALARLIEEEALLRRIDALMQPETAGTLIDHLRLTGAYAGLLSRARTKQRFLQARIREDQADMSNSVQDGHLWQWYFVERLGRPDVPDLAVYADALGYEDVWALRQAVLGEYLYTRSGEGTYPPPLVD